MGSSFPVCPSSILARGISPRPGMLLGGGTSHSVKGINIEEVDELFGMVHKGMTKSKGLTVWINFQSVS